MFSNDVTPSVELPQLASLTYERLADNAPWESVYSSTIFNVIVLIAAVVSLFFTEKLASDLGVFVIAGLLLLFAMGYWYTFVSHKYKGLVLREHDILFKSGMFWRKTTAVPFNRVQHLETHRGLFERKLDLASLRIFTAGGAGADLKISGLQVERAERIKQHLLIKAGLASEESQVDSVTSALAPATNVVEENLVEAQSADVQETKDVD
ncbi:PH domain-containing protein [Alteromonadaceae bacterium BrNp21-10]|nr:PH domain-containing protein [Alteromonadaceae bacterium BrNp21-10]